MSFHYSAPSTSNSQPSSSRMAFPAGTQRTSTKRSFDDYGHNDAGSSSQPFGSSTPIAQTMATSSMADAMGNILGLEAGPAVEMLEDSAINAQNTRFKRRRNSLNATDIENVLPPSMPVEGFHSISDPTSTTRDMSTTEDAQMVWNSEPAANLSAPATRLQPANSPLSSSDSPSDQSTADGVRGSISRILERTLNPPEPWNGVSPYYIAPDNSRNNRMSWISDAPPNFDTVTTNTEPGWNFGASRRDVGPGVDLGYPIFSNDSSTSSSRQPENNHEIRSSFPASSSSRPNIHIVPASYETSSSNLNQMPSPQTDFSHSSFFGRRNYSPIMISDSDESMDVRTRWPSPLPSPPLPSQSNPSTHLSWWPPTWNYMEENRVPPPPTHSPPAPPHAATVHQSNFSMPAAPANVDNQVTGNSSRSNLRRPRRPSDTAWDFLGLAPRTPNEDRPFSYYLPSPSDVSAPSSIHRGFPGAPYSGHNEEPSTAFNNGSMQNHRHSASDSDSTMDLHRLLTRHTGLGNVDRFSEMPMPRSIDHPFGPPAAYSHSHVQTSAVQETSSGSRRVRFPDDIHQAPPSNRVVSPPPPPNRRTSFPFHALFDRHTRRNEGEVSGYTAPSASHTRSSSDSAQGNDQPTSQGAPFSRPLERADSWRESLYPGSIPRRPIEPVMFSRIADNDSRETTPRPAGPRIRESITGANQFHNMVHDDWTPFQTEQTRERERQELNSFLNRQPSRPTRPNLTPNTNTGWPRERPSYLPPGLRADSPVPPPPAMNRPRVGLSGLSTHFSGPSFPNRSPTPTPSSPSSESPPSPIHHLPFLGDHRPYSLYDEPPPLPVPNRRAPRRMSGRIDHPFSWLDDSPVAAPPFILDDDMFPGPTSTTRARAGRGSRVGRQPYRMFSLGRMRSVGDYVLDDDFDDSYESLLALEQFIGPVKRGCSTEVINQLLSGTFEKLVGDTKKADTEEEKCPVCLDEYEKEQICMKLPRCSHIYHKDCITGWLKTANTCPVCREVVEGPSRSEASATPSSRRSASRAHRISQGISQYLRESSGPSSTTTGNSQNLRRTVRRRSTNESQISVPPMRDLAVDAPSSGSNRRDRARRLQMDFVGPDMGSSAPFTPIHRRYESDETNNHAARPTPHPSRPSPEAPPRFTRGPLARFLASRDPEVAGVSRYT